MANVQISALPSTTSTTLNDWVIKNDSGETTTNKTQLRYITGLQKGVGSQSLKSANFLTTNPSSAGYLGAIALGDGANADGDYSVAVGTDIQSAGGQRNYYTAIGGSIKVAQESICIGYDAEALSAYAVGIGNKSEVFSDGGVAIGFDSILRNYHQAQIGIGMSADTNADYAIGIGYQSKVTHPRAVSLGYQVQSIFSATTHVKSLYVDDNLSFQDVALTNLATFNVDLSVGTYFTLTLNQNAVLNFSNHRQGAIYYIYINNTGTYNFTSVNTATGTLFFNDNGRKNLTHNGKDLWVINAFGNTQLVTQNQNFV